MTTLPKDQYTVCPNCGTQLIGAYCHQCGQRAAKQTTKDFILEYIGNAYIWDQKFWRTFKMLLLKPGSLTKEYAAEKFASYTHPLKLNMFLLVVFGMLFFFFADTTELGNFVEQYTQDEEAYSLLALDRVSTDDVFADQILNGSRDTIRLEVSARALAEYPQLLVPVDSNDADSIRTVVVPSILLEQKILAGNNDEGYYFDQNSEFATKHMSLNAVSLMWRDFINVLTQYFPVFILLTVPFLAFSVFMINRRKKMLKVHAIIFSLHYTAFLEVLIIFVYILYLIIPKVYDWLDNAVAITALLYLSIAIKRFFERTSWMRAVLKSLMINIFYLLICTSALLVIFFIIIIKAIINNPDMLQ